MISPTLVNTFRQQLRQFLPWVKFQEINREGWLNAYRRQKMQKLILKTRPIRTAKAGPKEVRILTWRRDWMNAIWSLKTFYHYSQIDYPLYIHDGGLEHGQAEILKSHFPDAYLISREQADREVEKELKNRKFAKSLEYRHLNTSSLKVFDFFLLSRAQVLISIDSDIVFFRAPKELLGDPAQHRKNLFHPDIQYSYSLPLDELEKAFGVRPPPYIASGLSAVSRESVDFAKIEKWLEYPPLFADKWVTEQTLHALCSAIFGVELLPSTYLVSITPGLNDQLICKHYPGFLRPLLYQEGMLHLAEQTPFLSECGGKTVL